MSHIPIMPSILYWGTPVVLITTTNLVGADDDSLSFNIAPMSSAFWLGDRCMLGLTGISQTAQNILRTKQCVLNLPAYTPTMVEAVNNLAMTTGTKDFPPSKAAMGYRYVKDKFGAAGLSPVQSSSVVPPRIQECAVQMEAEMVSYHTMFGDHKDTMKGFTLAIEMRVVKVFVDERIRMSGKMHRIDPDKWRPMIMSFQQLYGLSRRGDFGGQAENESHRPNAESKLAQVDEEMYRLPVLEET